MKNLYSYILLAFLLTLGLDASGQGCVAIRSFSGCAAGTAGSPILKPGDAMLSGNFRYFHSFRHFRGREEETHRIEEGTEVINDSYFMDLSFTYAFANRFYASLTVPFVYHERSSMYEHGGNSLGQRHKTYAKGLGDMRIAAGYWLFAEEKRPGTNMALALGLKLPTGEPGAEGKFYNAGPDGETVTRPVDQSIQPGDGGLGITVEMQGFHQLNERLILNGNFYYLINPREHNGVRRRDGADPYASPDQYAIRLGATYTSLFPGFDVYLGGRMECVPVNDLIGGSNAYRRPGYAISIEPGVSYVINNLLLNVSVPIAVERNRTQSYLDKQRERLTGQPRHGDAAFADYLINVGIAYRLNKKDKKMDVFNADH
ncbi:transporter [Fulvivirga imtechensis]|nr:transporter [Fulvivirga imtechensis]